MVSKTPRFGQRFLKRKKKDKRKELSLASECEHVTLEHALIGCQTWHD